VRPFHEQAVSNLDPQRSMHRPVWVTHSSFTVGSHTTENTASGYDVDQLCIFAPTKRYLPSSLKRLRLLPLLIRLGGF
jgi:hypothetical protein